MNLYFEYDDDDDDAIDDDRNDVDDMDAPTSLKTSDPFFQDSRKKGQ